MLSVMGFLMGGGKSIIKFAMAHWKIILLIVVLVVGFFMHQRAVTNYGNERYRAGVTDTLAKTKKVIAEKNKKNRELERQLDDQINQYAEKIAKKDAERKQSEERISKRIEKILDSVPEWSDDQCSITDELLRERNNIRALGPK